MRCQSCGRELGEGSSYCPYCFREVSPAGRGGAGIGGDDFGPLFDSAVRLWKENLGRLVTFTLVFLLVGWIPIVNTAFYAGYTRGLLSLARGGRPIIGDIFSAWDRFGNALAYSLIFLFSLIGAGFIPFFGPLAQAAVTVFGTPGFYPIADRNMNAVDAIRWSIATVRRHFLAWLLAVLVGGVIASIGIVALFVGIVVTLPLGTLLVIQQYEAVKGEG